MSERVFVLNCGPQLIEAIENIFKYRKGKHEKKKRKRKKKMRSHYPSLRR